MIHNLCIVQDFKDGITNGNAWYALYGGMQDWNYVAANCMEITLELSNQKNAPAASLPKLWKDNLKAMLNYAVESAFGGVSGYVTSGKTGVPLVATIIVEGINHDIYSNPVFGDFHRSLAAGSYRITASADGHLSQTKTVKVPKKLGVGAAVFFQLDGETQGATAPMRLAREGKGKSCGFRCLWGVLKFLE